MGQVTHEQVDLMLKLYEMRREPRLRQARAWFIEKFNPTSAEEMMKLYPFGSEENANVRMVTSYWEMVASIVNRNLIDEDLFFESTGEQWVVWERLKVVTPAMRALFKNPHANAQLEEHCKRLEAWREKRAPGTTAAMRQLLAQMAQAKQQAKVAGD